MALLKMSEFIDMAIRDEESGEAYYQALAEQFNEPKFKKTFTMLSLQEKDHAARFKKMLNEIGTYKPFEQFPGQYDEYLNALLAMRAFKSPKDAMAQAAKSKNIRNAVELALKIERDTLLFYFEMLTFIPDTHRNYVKDIIDEERTHVLDLQEIVSSL